MIERIQNALSTLAALTILLTLHAIHGGTLLLALFLHLINHLRLYVPLRNASTSSSIQCHSIPSTKTLSQDKALWKSRKSPPKTLGMIFVPAARGYFSLSKLSYIPWDEGTVYNGMMNDIGHLVRWAKELEIENLVLYDENGILKRYADRLHASLQQQLKKQSFAISSTAFIQDGLRISLLSREDGKEHVANVTKSLAKGIQAGFIDKEEIDVDYLQEKIYSSSGPEPDLLLVLGGLHLRLRGFPPWHTRLCEIYHDSSLSLLGPPRLRYTAFQRAMDNYSGCEQRFGR